MAFSCVLHFLFAIFFFLFSLNANSNTIETPRAGGCSFLHPGVLLQRFGLNRKKPPNKPPFAPFSSQLAAYRKHRLEKPFSDCLFVGDFSALWTIRDFRRKVLWRERSSSSPALVTSRFAFAGLRHFRLKFSPWGNMSSKPGFVSLQLQQVETWRELIYPILLTVGGTTRGPFRYRSAEYFRAANSFCKLEDLKPEADTLKVFVEVAPM